MNVVQEPTAEAKPALPVLLPDGFAETMDDGTPVTSQNLFAYLAEYVELDGLLHSMASAVVAGFSYDAGFQQLLRERATADAILDYLFSPGTFSKERMCFIVDLMAVQHIFSEFYSNYGYGSFVVSSGELASGWDPEKVEVCMCLKAWMCLSLWQEVGARIRDSASWRRCKDFQEFYDEWTKPHEAYPDGISLQRAIMGPGRRNFLTLLRDAWTEPHEDVMYPNSSLNILYPRASVLWRPPTRWRHLLA